MRIQDICTANPRTCAPDSNLASVAGMMWETDCGIIPVVDWNNKILGVVTDRDIAIAASTRNLSPALITAGDVISRKVHSCRLQDDVRIALRTMTKESVRRLLVVDDSGRLQGIISLNDIVLASRDAKAGRPGDVTYQEVVAVLDAICRPAMARGEGTPKRGPLVVANA